MASLRYKPEWAKYEKDITNPDPVIAGKAAEAFDETRKAEMKNDPKARQWETERKQAFLKDKPEFTKQRIKKEKLDFDNQIDKYLNGGIIMGKFIPSPGFVLVKPIEIDKTGGGIYLPEGVQTGDVQEPNRGIVVAVGKDKYFTNGQIVESPCKVGDTIMFKWHTMQMLYDGKKHHFMSFEDIFGILE